MPLRLALGVHNHQPVGNFDFVFEQAYHDAYLPFLELIERFPDIRFSLHNSGPLLEWILARKPEYVDKLRNLVLRGQAEILGGAFYEPILPGIPRRDRTGQICAFSGYLESLFGVRVRGMWLAERVWEPEQVTDLTRSGIEFTLLDDYHFKQAGADPDRLFGYYLTEDEGKLLKVFPISEPLRYLVPWKEPEAAVDYLVELAAREPNGVVVCADDGEKFGGWPGTHERCFTGGWLERFFTLLGQRADVIRCCTLSEAIDDTPAVGLLYLPDSSYREMAEWSLPPGRLAQYQRMIRALDVYPGKADVLPFLRAGFWRNFRAKYPEAHEMYARMIEVSEKVQAWEKEQTALSCRSIGAADANPAMELYRAQCNCGYWHGAFGGLYLPHLRNAVYHHLLAAENAITQASVRTLTRIESAVRDFNLDGQPEVCLANLLISAYFTPHLGGALYELDIRSICHNLLSTLSRRSEVYHETVRAYANGPEEAAQGEGLHEQVKFKHEGLAEQLIYDSYPRKSGIDHFYAATATLDRVARGVEPELGDGVAAPYDFQIERGRDEVAVTFRRLASVDGVPIRVTKTATVAASRQAVQFRCVLEDLPRECNWLFAMEFNFAGMAAHADDRYFSCPGTPRAGQLQTFQNVPALERFALVDEWLGLTAELRVSRPADFWAFPIQSVSQSEGGFELVHQSTAVLPHWPIRPDPAGRWEIGIELNVETRGS